MTDTPAETLRRDEVRERGRIEGDLGEWLTQKIWDESRLHLGAAQFRPLYSEEAEELGYDDDDPEVLLRRESDGAVFEADIEVTVRLVPAEGERAEAKGQLPLPGVPA
jgi:hypothetical protein